MPWGRTLISYEASCPHFQVNRKWQGWGFDL